MHLRTDDLHRFGPDLPCQERPAGSAGVRCGASPRECVYDTNQTF